MRSIRSTVFGPTFWLLIHDLTKLFEKSKKKDLIHSFFLNLKNILPCRHCRTNYEPHQEWLSRFSQDMINNTDYEKLAFDIHTHVSRRLVDQTHARAIDCSVNKDLLSRNVQKRMTIIDFTIASSFSNTKTISYNQVKETSLLSSEAHTETLYKCILYALHADFTRENVETFVFNNLCPLYEELLFRKKCMVTATESLNILSCISPEPQQTLTNLMKHSRLHPTFKFDEFMEKVRDHVVEC